MGNSNLLHSLLSAILPVSRHNSSLSYCYLWGDRGQLMQWPLCHWWNCASILALEGELAGNFDPRLALKSLHFVSGECDMPPFDNMPP